MPNIERVEIDSYMPDAPILIEGVAEINTLCPINKLTGKRSSTLSILNMVSDGKVNDRMVNLVLQELPRLSQDTSMTDQQRFEFVSERLMTGSPAEDTLVAERLFSVASSLGIVKSDLSRDSDGKIVFDRSSEKEIVENEAE